LNYLTFLHATFFLSGKIKYIELIEKYGR
jgi:hypothetical protein